MKAKNGKSIAIAVCVALLLSIGTIAAYAATGSEPLNFFGVRTEEDGSVFYSTDGEIWSENLPEGATVDSDGGVTFEFPDGGVAYGYSGEYTGEFPSISQMDRHRDIESFVGVRHGDDGDIRYTTDGETWIEGLPDGAVMDTDGGSVSFSLTIEP